ALDVPRLSPVARRVDRLLAARPDPAVVLVPGGCGAAVLAGEPAGAGAVAGLVVGARGLEGPGAGPAGGLSAVGGQASDEFHIRGHAVADRPGIRVPVRAGVPAGPGPVDRPA